MHGLALLFFADSLRAVRDRGSDWKRCLTQRSPRFTKVNFRFAPLWPLCECIFPVILRR
jgi:hypothetical protein